ncbi:ammonia channel protein [Desulfococcus multivorans]|uniref:Ammonium transporter n=2 Tax=Desulfococcaceae TaxID=2931039 RepID=S7TYK0_DESML|nr:ammonia channel protein [Desulfococcus multivorans]EPR41785.1 ammonium transporter [Desulfococcus multivorans DSM 2059]SJZ88223.1 ammonium transporter [Desulfococcus multivorans DSM 2059]
MKSGEKWRMKCKLILLTAVLTVLPFSSAFAQDVMNSGDTAWIIVSSALVMMMTPAGLALFYGGMSRYKNLLNTLAMTFIAYCLSSIVWVLWGYTLAFGPDVGEFIGGLDYLFLDGITVGSLTGTIPTTVFVVFQMTFAAITVALVLGSIVDRMKFSSWIVFVVLWLTFVYSPVCHWVWGGGWMHAMGALDFAGGNVVHINAGVAGLVLSAMVGKRIGYGKDAMFPSSITLTALGAAMLWFGWFGFNAGSALAADGVAASAFLVTNTSAAMGAIAWMAAEWYVNKRPTVLGIASGVVAGLVSITPAAGFVDMKAALVIGLVAGAFGFYSVAVLKRKLGYDDSLDAFGVHGMCGIWGALATGIFANPAITGGAAGLLYGNPRQIWIQFVSVIATALFSALATFIVVLVTRVVTGGLRVEEDDEVKGLDGAIHGERGFEIEF